MPNKILVSPFGEICHHGVVFTKNLSPSASFRGITSNFVFRVFRVFSGTETETDVRFLISCLLSNIQTVRLHFVDN